MVRTGRMAYGEVPHHAHDRAHVVRHRRQVAVRTVAVLAVALVLALSADWVQRNWAAFEGRTDRTLCHLLDDRC